MNLYYPSNPAQGATYSDFCTVLEKLWCNYYLEPTSIEINPTDERLLSKWVPVPLYRYDLTDAGELVGVYQEQDIAIVSFTNPTTGHQIRLATNERVRLGTMRFLDARGVPLALLELYSLAGKALARSQG